MRQISPKVKRLDGIELNEQHGAGYKLALKRSVIRKHIKPGRTLDLGCGNGLVSMGFGDVTGVDISDTRLSQAKENGLRVVNADVLNTGLKNGHYDTVIVTDLIEHMQRPYDLLLECNRLLREGGQVFLETPNALNFERFIKLLVVPTAREESPNHLFLLDRISLTEMLTRSDFEIDKIYYFGFTFPMWRKLVKVIAKNKAQGPVNPDKIGLMSKIMLLLGGVFKPFAYSMMIVAHKRTGLGDKTRADPADVFAE